MITIIDYNAGNIGSIQNMIKKIGGESIVTSDPDLVRKATKLILPGVGHFDYGMGNLIETGLIPILNQRVLEDKIPILGICLGAQLFTQRSEEGKTPGLGWFSAETVRFKPSSTSIKVPHMGWSGVELYNRKSKIFADMHEDPRFYFVHSYHMKTENNDEILAFSEYGYRFVSALEKENIVGIQFHPEKSHKFGMKILENFINLYQ
ncbi:imidazole glycerol phosphate synthase subunit HisH [Chitinophaga sp. NPDC101104]|uniref:imidazole glycerol phosphate synthase subunit HisH n=1 Tax=Chitinophaga sp. NPDC101104 TaxID=3390561 RepID=UPI003D041894